MRIRVNPWLIHLLASLVLNAALPAQSPVTITVDPNATGFKIPADFTGLSFESSNLLAKPDGARIFSPGNKPLVELFHALGIHSLRVGGGTADQANYAIPGEKDVDALFAFAAAAGVKVIYTLRLPRADVGRDAAIAAYIERKYAPQLTCFEIGNEPDFYRRVFREIPDYAAYRPLWKAIADAVIQVAPHAKFCGPAAGGVTAWSRSLAHDFGKSGLLAAIVQHEYTGGDGNLISDAPARDEMLSRAWMEDYDRLYQSFAVAALDNGLPYRLEETNNFTGGAKNATDTFAASLWALDYMHWWAAHHCSGINFHNRRWILNTTIYPVIPADDGIKSGYKVHPIAYGIQAFNAGGHGATVPLTISNPDAVNITAYAVRDENNLFVTVINKKDPNTPPRDAKVAIQFPGISIIADVKFLRAPQNEVASKEGIQIETQQNQPPSAIDVPGASAAIIKLNTNEHK